jgi:hypothetical protein
MLYVTILKKPLNITLSAKILHQKLPHPPLLNFHFKWKPCLAPLIILNIL